MSPFSVAVQIEEPYQQGMTSQHEALRRAALATLTQQGTPESSAADDSAADNSAEGPCEVVVVVTGDEVLHELNRRHRGVDAPTDVLAFPNESRGPFVDAPELPRYLGDVIISFPRARAQAEEAGNDLLAELQLLVVHGVLHLLGYDDQTEPERTRMWQAQRAVLDGLGVEVQFPD